MAKRTFHIVGRLIDRVTNRGVEGFKVEAWDKDLLVNDLVASAVTDAQGDFRMDFDQSYFKELFLDRAPDLFFRVYNEGVLIKSTEDSVLWNVKSSKTKVLIEVDVVEAASPSPGGSDKPSIWCDDEHTRGTDALQRLVAQAKEDPAFFHALVFDPENVLSKLDYLDREAKASLLAISPEQFIRLWTEMRGSQCDYTCGVTCGSRTCC